MDEKELETFILSPKGKNNQDARYVLGKYMVEGSNPKIQHNWNKGLNWLKEAAKAGHLGAIEYKTYHDIRFDRKPNIEKLMENLT